MLLNHMPYARYIEFNLFNHILMEKTIYTILLIIVILKKLLTTLKKVTFP